ncbi:MAG: 2-nitropropane dioxygenase [Sedimentibacter sp.]|jgi:enoyl-[acyl-carrier protein] reductase II|nr:2-nitropropane dioxygenase [Sedimentibacter sp.]
MEENLKTKLTDLLNIKYPILQGAMAWVSEANLASAVSNSGGAGIIATGGRTVSWTKEQIHLAKSLTDKPFGVNIVLMDKNKDDILDLICHEKVAFVTLGAGNPVPYFDILKKAGILAIPVVPSLKLAKRVEENGADALIIEGMEAGGHIGKLTTLALMTQVIPEIKIPVIAAGGFSEGRGLAAALVMGASGIQVGTRFYASKECTAHINAKDAIINAGDTDTEITGYLRGHAVRGLKNKMTEKYIQLEKDNAPYEQLHDLIVGTSKKAPVDGDIEWGLVQAGQSLSVIKSIESCEQIVLEMILQAENAIKNVTMKSNTN